MKLDDIQGRATITVTEAGRLLGLSRNSAYLAAGRDEIPTLRLGRRLVVPVPALLGMLGADPPANEDTPGGASTEGVRSLGRSTEPRTRHEC